MQGIKEYHQLFAKVLKETGSFDIAVREIVTIAYQKGAEEARYASKVRVLDDRLEAHKNLLDKG